MPSMAAASKGGEERVAHTGAAVTSPAASAIATSMAGSRSGQPAASLAAGQASRARAAGGGGEPLRAARGFPRGVPGFPGLRGGDVADERAGGHGLPNGAASH